MLENQSNKRFDYYRTGFNQPSKCGLCHILLDHFRKNVWKNAKNSFQILEKFQGNGRTSRNAYNASITSSRK